MVMQWGCGILLSVGFAVSLGQRKFSDLAFSNVLVRPSLILHYAGYAIVEPLVGFLLWLFLLHLRFCAALTAAGSFLAASACPALALDAWVGQPPFPLRSQCFSCAGWLADDRWVPRTVRVVLPRRL